MSGLTDFKSVTLVNNGSESLTLSANGVFTFANQLPANSAYSVVVSTQPVGMTCTVSNGSGTLTSTVSSVTVSCANRTGKYAYVTNFNGDSISAFSINASTGGLTAVAGQPFSAITTKPTSVAAHPSGKYIYVTSASSGIALPVSAYSVNRSTGALTLIADYATVPSTGSYSVALNPSGTYAYVANAIGSVSAFTINQNTGALTLINTYSTGAGSGPISTTVDPSGRYVYVLNQATNDIVAFSINQTSGSLTEIGSVAAGTIGLGITVDPSGSYLYTASKLGGTSIQIFSINTNNGTLTRLGGVGDGSTTDSVTISQSGDFLYNVLSGNVIVYSRNKSTGALTLVGTYSNGGYGGNNLTLDPSGSYAYVPNKGSNDVSILTVNQTTGALTAQTPVATGLYSTSVAIAVEQ